MSQASIWHSPKSLDNFHSAVCRCRSNTGSGLTVVLGLLATLPAKVPYGSSGNVSTRAPGYQSFLLTISGVMASTVLITVLTP